MLMKMTALESAKVLGGVLLSTGIGTTAFIYFINRFARNSSKTKPVPPLEEFIKELTSKATETENEYYEIVAKCLCDGDCGLEDVSPIRDLIRGNIYRAILLVDELLYKQDKNKQTKDKYNVATSYFITYYYHEAADKWDPLTGKSFLDEFCDCVLTESCLYLKKYNFVKAL